MQREPWRNVLAWVTLLSAVQIKLAAQQCVAELGDVATVSAQLATAGNQWLWLILPPDMETRLSRRFPRTWGNAD